MAPVDLISIVVAAAICVVVAVRVVRALASVAVPLGIAIVAVLFVLNRVDEGAALERSLDMALPFLKDLSVQLLALTKAP